jgi:hypothetical protein
MTHLHDSIISILTPPGAGRTLTAALHRRFLYGVRPRAMPPPDGLLLSAEAARKLRCSVKTLNGYVTAGALGYVIIGHGRKRPRRMFTQADLDAFIQAQTRKDVPCPSTRTATVARRTSTSTSKCEVIDFTGPRKPPRDAKPRK